MINVEWLQRLEAQRGDLTKREQEIVDYIEEHFSEFARLSMQDLVDATNTSRPTVHRLCTKLGYNGFKACKQALLQYTRSMRTALPDIDPSALTPRRASDDAMQDAASAFELFQHAFSVDARALQQTAVTFTANQIDDLVRLIRAASTVYCVGYQSGVFPARFLAERLSRVHIRTHLATGDQRAVLDAVFALDTGDLLLLCEYQKSFDLHVTLCDLARKRGARVILLTDYPTSPAVSRADEVLIAHRGLSGFQNSMAVPMTMVNGLLLAVEFALGPEREHWLQEWDDWQSYRD